MTRKPFIAGNWKMYKNGQQAQDFIRQFIPLVNSWEAHQVGLAVSATVLKEAVSTVATVGSFPLIIGAQNMHWEIEGAFTGEISGSMIKGTGATMVILGHSERRQLFGETDEWVARKLAAALDYGLTPIVCVGETLQDRESGRTFNVLANQLTGCLAGVSDHSLGSIVLAYEPVWAIGTGVTATVEQAQEAHAFIRGRLSRQFSPQAAEAVRILYGGSVKPDNAKSLLDQSDIDGALIGGASLDPVSLAKIVNLA
ncbi:MAG: triose-phosphate isomerase [Deltaproteobacteria bacterium]|jgi:triosephosphate isomerase|nr:triose-phosphate isomerase [Deltaproteobacteria bacterium]